MDNMNQHNCIFTANTSSSSSSLDMVVQDHALHSHHQLPFDSFFMDNHLLQVSATAGGDHVHCEKAKSPEMMQEEPEEEEEQLSAMKEMLYKIAVMQPVDVDPATIRKPKRRNVRISDDPQSVAARHRRERISEKIRILQRLVPGGTKMDTASMLEEATRYIKFLKKQIRQLEGNQQHQQSCTFGSVQGGLAARQWEIPVSSNPGSGVDPSRAVPQEFSFGGSIANGSILNFNNEVIGDN